MLNSGDVNEALESFVHSVFDVYDSCFPVEEVSNRKRQPGGFRFSDGLKRLRRGVHKALVRYKKLGTEEAKTNFYCKEGHYRQSLGRARSAFYERKFKALKGKPSSLWRLVNDICGRGKGKAEVPNKIQVDGVMASDPQDVVDALNSHFSKIGLKTVQTLGPLEDVSEYLRTLWQAKPNSFSLTSASVEEIRSAMKSTKADSKGGIHEVPSWLLKRECSVLAMPLATSSTCRFSPDNFPRR